MRPAPRTTTPPAAPPTGGRKAILDRETFAKIRRIQIRTRTILESGIGGAYHAVFKGRGMEFAEVREYQPGDDVRTIDWNVTARMGSLHIKKFVEERDLTLLLAVDVSGSQSFGSNFILKRDYAVELAAVLAFSAVFNHDRVGAVLFSDRIEGYAPPGRGRDHALRIVRDLLAITPRGRGTDIAMGLGFAQRVMKRRGIVAVISDFQGEGFEKGIGVLRRRHDVIALHLTDPREREFPDVGLVALLDPETGERIVVDASRADIRPHLAARALTDAPATFKRTRVDALALSTAESYEKPLAAFFKARERRR